MKKVCLLMLMFIFISTSIVLAVEVSEVPGVMSMIVLDSAIIFEVAEPVEFNLDVTSFLGYDGVLEGFANLLIAGRKIPITAILIWSVLELSNRPEGGVATSLKYPSGVFAL